MDSNNNNMSDSNNHNKPKNPVIINHYHYGGSNGGSNNNQNNTTQNRNNNRNRNQNRNRGRRGNNNNNNIDNKNDIKISIPIDYSGNVASSYTPKVIAENISPNNRAMSPRSHIIVRSTTDPNNMRIIPFNQPLNPFMMQPSFLRSLFEKDNQESKSNNETNENQTEKQNDEREYVEISDVKTIEDLIELGEKYDINDKRRFPIDMNKLKKIVDPLKELKSVIGMTSVKTNIFEQLIYILQELNDSNMMHTVIEGPPGVGKTLLGKILAKIYCKLDFLKKSERNKEEDEINNITSQLLSVLNPNLAASQKDKEIKEKEKKEEYKFKVVRRSDLIGQYVGSTAIKTQKVIDEAEGGVLFIDEVYSLGSGGTNDKSDSFAKECIDTLNQNLSENGDKFICIIAGYPAEIERCFFSQNEGLKRRFPFKYNIEKYDSKELSQIFENKVKEINWKIHSDLKLYDIEKFIEKNKKHFEHFGGDIENLLLNIKIKHSLRIFGKDPKNRKLINMEDIKLAFEEFQKVKKLKELPQYVKDMYV